MESISGLYGKAGDCAYDKVEQQKIPPNSKELSKVFIQSTIYENTQHNPKRTNQHDFKSMLTRRTSMYISKNKYCNYVTTRRASTKRNRWTSNVRFNSFCNRNSCNHVSCLVPIQEPPTCNFQNELRSSHRRGDLLQHSDL